MNGILLFDHSRDKPVFTIGKGTFDAVEYFGNYNISDEITEKYELQNWEIGKNEALFGIVNLKLAADFW